MTDGYSLFTDAPRGEWVRLRTLLTLRWLAIAGQSMAVLIADQAVGLDLPLGWCVAAITAAICFNIVETLVNPASKRLSEQAAMLAFLFDISQLTALLFLTGGLANPFALLYLAPVTISATVLNLRSMAVLGAFAVIGMSLIAVFHVPLRFDDGTWLDAPPLFIGGMWSALLIGIVFVSLYARRVTNETYAMSRALAETQMALGREQRLTAIGGLAAAAAHELGTPLATIKLASAELARELGDAPELQEDARLIRDQAERCREILRRLGERGRDDMHIKSAPIAAVIREAAAPHRDRGARLILRLRGEPLGEESEGAAQPTIRRRPEIIHGLRNLIQNAVDFAMSTIWIDIDWTETDLKISVGDDGPGFRADVLGRLGDPFLTRRRPRGGRKSYDGMGLGLFIAKTLLERTGAQLTFANGSDETTPRDAERTATDRMRPPGAVVVVVWPLSEVAATTETTRRALGQNPEFTLGNI